MLRVSRKKKLISMTPLVDVIFLLLLFFMLSSTFSKFAEVELNATSGSASDDSNTAIFVQLFPDRLTVNGKQATLTSLGIPAEDVQSLLVSLKDGVTAQRLTDLLVALRSYPDLSVTVLGAG